MYRTVSLGVAERIAERMHKESHALAADWLSRLSSLLPEPVEEIFPSSQLLDHIPLLIRHIADYLRAPADLEIAANTLVIEKAQELGQLRHQQRASVHQILREYDILAEILEQFLTRECAALDAASASPLDGLGIMQRLGHAIRTLMQTTVDTFIGEYTATIGQQREKLESFNRMVTHELRNPLSTLRFAANLLGREEIALDPEGQRRVMRLVERNVERTIELVRSLEHLAFAERPVDAPNQQRVKLASVAGEATRQLADMAQARGVELRIDANLPEILIEAAQLELVLVNVVSNAIKYSDQRKAERYVEIREHPSAQSGHCVLAVADNGIGIPADKLPDVFRRFFRAHRERDEELGIDGYGLGLAITEEAVRVLGGQLRVESTEGQGTTVYITLPVPPVDEPAD